MQQVYPLRKLKNSLPFIPSFHDWLNLMAGIRLSPPQDVHIPEHLQVYSYFAIFRNITELAESKQSHGNSKTCRRGYTHWLFWERCKGIKFQISISEIYISKIYLSKPENHLWFLTIWFGLVLRRWFGFGFFETIFSKPYHTVCTIRDGSQRWLSITEIRFTWAKAQELYLLSLTNIFLPTSKATIMQYCRWLCLQRKTLAISGTEFADLLGVDQNSCSMPFLPSETNQFFSPVHLKFACIDHR